MIRCPKCSQVHAINCSGMVRGKQRYYCKECNVYFTLSENVPVVTEEAAVRKKHMTTIADIAQALNISKSTVSRALHEHSDINPATKKAVMEMAQQLDYTPNLLAQSLVRSRSNTIGIIVPELVTYFFPTVIIGATEVATEAGYNVVICQSQESLKSEIANVNVLLASRVEGVLVSMTRETGTFDHFRSFERHGVPMVFYNRVCDELNSPKVLVNDYEGAFKATEHLIKNGYKRIAHIGGPSNLRLSFNRLNGYTDALKRYGFPVKDELIVKSDLSRQGSVRCAKRLLGLPEPPDAVFCVNDPTAIQLMLVAKSMGISIPGALGVVGFSNDPIAAVIEPSLTTIEQPVAEMGRVAMQLLIDTLKDEHVESNPAFISLGTKLIKRGSSQR
ncbi:MAG: LacI family DNA-binding transcriptional regulator [Sphingobacteriales bacterium]|nr:LacI family DNA-binding transcriptional regulator [Sphingobacteriales bacterium]